MDPNSNADVRLLLGRLADLAEETRAAVVLVSHHRKGGYGPAIHRTIGSLAFAAVARVVWNVVHGPTGPERRLLVLVKVNPGRRPSGTPFPGHLRLSALGARSRATTPVRVQCT